jgi:hypothetical protein
MKLIASYYPLRCFEIFLIPCISLVVMRDLSALCFNIAWIKWSLSVKLFMKEEE